MGTGTLPQLGQPLHYKPFAVYFRIAPDGVSQAELRSETWASFKEGSPKPTLCAQRLIWRKCMCEDDVMPASRACCEAEEALASQRRFSLNAEQWDAFVAALDRPVRSMPRLQRLFAEASVLEKRPS